MRRVTAGTDTREDTGVAMASKDEVKKETLEEMPDTLKRSPAKAQKTWAKAHDSAVES